MKKDHLYFQNFAECAQLSLQMAEHLNSFWKEYDPALLEKEMGVIHEMEHQADGKKHELFSQLVRAFVTPIDRDEIINISQSIDDVIDAMDDIMIQLNIAQVKDVKPDSLPLAELMVRCCKALQAMMEEFQDFKKSKRMKDLIIDINHLEEEGDRLHFDAMKNLHTNTKDALEVVVWREIYEAFELVFDKCEDVADIIEGVLIENV